MRRSRPVQPLNGDSEAGCLAPAKPYQASMTEPFRRNKWTAYCKHSSITSILIFLHMCTPLFECAGGGVAPHRMYMLHRFNNIPKSTSMTPVA